MKILVKEKTGSTKLDFPWIPDKVSFKSGGMKFSLYEIQAYGEVARPAGVGLREVSFEGRFPGKARIGHPFLTGAWKAPRTYQSILNKWRRDRVLLKLTISETPISMYCYLANYDMDYKEGFGDYFYKVSFKEYRPIQIKTKKNKKKAGSSGKNNIKAKAALIKRPVSNQLLHQVRVGEDLWQIAKKTLGDGERWQSIYQLNQAAVEQAAKAHGETSSNNGTLLYPGTNLKLPKK